MRFEWNYSRQTEIERIVFTAGSIVHGYYQQMGFLLLEKTLKKTSIPTVIFPKIQLSQETWSELAKKEQGVGKIAISKKALAEFSSQCKDLDLLTDTQITTKQKNWQKIEKEVSELFEVMFPDNPYRKVIVFPTKYGTCGSHHSTNNSTLHIALREDTSIEHIVSLVLKIIVQSQYIKIQSQKEILDKNLWERKEAAVDFIMTQTAFKRFAKDYKGILDIIQNPEVPTSALDKSKEYYRELGFPTEKVFTIKGKRVMLLKTELDNLTFTQKNILLGLLGKENKILTFDEIANIMWRNEKLYKYSLASMSKMIFQLRQNLKEAGLQKEVIFTKRGQGYYLKQ